MRRDLVGLGISLIVIGIIIYFVGSYLSSPSYFMGHSLFELDQAYETHDLGNSLETIGLLIAVVGIVIIPVGYFVSPSAPGQTQYPIQNFQQPLPQPVKYCPNCRTQLLINDKFCSECGYRF